MTFRHSSGAGTISAAFAFPAELSESTRLSSFGTLLLSLKRLELEQG